MKTFVEEAFTQRPKSHIDNEKEFDARDDRPFEANITIVLLDIQTELTKV